MLVGIIPIFTQRNPLCPMSRVSTDETTQEALYQLIHSLGLPIRLRMSSGAHSEKDPRLLKKLTPEFACEYSVTVRYNGQGHAMQFVDKVQKRVSYNCCSEWMVQGNKVSILG